MANIRSLFMLALLAVLFVAINLFANTALRSTRLDLTQNRLFTLSDNTRNLLAKLDEPLRLRFFYSEKSAAGYPQLRLYAARVRDMLQELRDRSGGRITLEIIDPDMLSEEEDQAIAYGLTPLRTDGNEDIYFGLVGTNLADGLETIPYFSDERQSWLEYDLAQLILTLSQPHRPVLGIVTNLPLDTGPGGLAAAMEGHAEPFGIYEELNKRFDIRFLEQKFTAVPGQIDVLMIAHPAPLDPATLYAVDQFALGGGHIIAFVDPYSEVSHLRGPEGQPARGYKESSDLAPLLHQWGIDYTPMRILGDRALAMRVRGGDDAGLSENDYVFWLDVPRAYLAGDDVVTASLDHVNLGTPGSLLQTKDATTNFKPLIRSSKDARLYDRRMMSTAQSPETLLRDFEPDGISHVIAARITGPVASAFDLPEDESAVSHLARSKRDADIIVVADSDIFDDKFWLRRGVTGDADTPIADNANFILSAIDDLADAGDLIGLRARGPVARPFTLVTRLKREAERRYLVRREKLQAAMIAQQAQLDALQSRGAERTPVEKGAGKADAQDIPQLQAALTQSRKSLRQARLDLRREIDDLSLRLRLLNIAAIPILLTLIALALAAMRYRRRKMMNKTIKEAAP